MSAPKHTPGPWVVDKAPSTLGGNGFTVRAGGAIICAAFPGASTDRIEPVAELNARLIASAPDMLELLTLALPYVEEGEEFSAAHKRGLSARIRAALAKATEGEA